MLNFEALKPGVGVKTLSPGSAPTPTVNPESDEPTLNCMEMREIGRRQRRSSMRTDASNVVPHLFVKGCKW